ncbi:MAG: NADH-quinone oxidoreductase subunit NuoK [Bacteroides sp.]|nr:MAG: NADH-quinone oxidoreductase subunit NuoK [Bacteroides sp.]
MSFSIYLDYYIILSILLFFIGLIGLIIRNNIIIILMSIEIMFSSINLLLVSFSYFWNDSSGQIMIFFTMFIAAIEIAIGLAMIIMLNNKNNNKITIDNL